MATENYEQVRRLLLQAAPRTFVDIMHGYAVRTLNKGEELTPEENVVLTLCRRIVWRENAITPPAHLVKAVLWGVL